MMSSSDHDDPVVNNLTDQTLTDLIVLSYNQLGPTGQIHFVHVSLVAVNNTA
jgi:hypothetical protein